MRTENDYDQRRNRTFDHDHYAPPEWHVDIAGGHQIAGAVCHGIPYWFDASR
jgi:hypothetical protein